VVIAMAMQALNRKLLRDLWRMRGQAFAIAMVVAAGVSLYVTYLSNFESLRRTQQAYYQQQRFGDVFASLKRAPSSVAGLLRGIAGVSAVETRVVADVELDFPELNTPVTARLVSLPAAGRRPMLNDLYLRRGRWIDPNRPDEVLVAEAFVDAHQFEPGDSITALINGRLKRLRIAGVALSAEYIYTTTRGELVPDDKRFGVIWMDERALAAAFDMEGAFNDVVIALGPGAEANEVIARVDATLERYGGHGAIPRALQFSNWTLENELLQLESFGLLLPVIFLLVAGFVLNVALGRALSLQRPQIAALKALGYSNRELAWHYTKWALAVGIGGLLIGIGLGAWLGSLVGDIYNRYFKFPNLEFGVPLRTVLGAAALTLTAAGGGAYSAVRRAVRIPPAEAMRPEPPARYHKTIFETPWIARELGAVGRMVIRNISRHPLRAGASILGIASAVALLMVGMVMFDAMDHLINTQFWSMQRQDAAVGFIEPRSSAVRYELAALPGVLAVELQRRVPVRVRAGHRDRYVTITGIDPDGRLQRIVDGDGRVFAVPAAGIAMSAALAAGLRVSAGDAVTIEVLEGDRRRHQLQVTTLVDDVLGLTIYMDAPALHRLLREGDTASGAMLLVDQQYAEPLLRRLKAMPGVAGVSLKRAVLKAFRDTMAATMNVTIFVNLLFAAVIAVGVVYNAARVALSERSHELASLRVLGYTRAEISLILLSELAVLTAAALPAGWALGYALCTAVFATVQSEVYRFPLYVSRPATAWASIGILASALLAGLIVRRRLDRLDLIAVLKVRE
jgi:putative ABC transport system permease protein